MWLIFDPLVLTVILLLGFQSLAFVALWLPFGILTVAQLVRAASSPGKEGLPNREYSVGNVKRWHIAAVCLVASTALVSGIWYAITSDPAANSSVSAVDLGGNIVFAFVEVLIWLVVGSCVFSFFYLGRLHQNGVRHAEFLWFGVCVIPATIFALSSFTPGEFLFDPTTNAGVFDGMPVVGAAGLVSYLVAVLIPRGVLKVCVWILSCGAILVALSFLVGPWNPVWLFTMIAAGYAAYRIEWKAELRSGKVSDQAAGHGDFGTDPQRATNAVSASATTVRRTVVFLTVLTVSVMVFVLVSGSGPILNGAVSAVFVALLSLTIALMGAAATLIASTAFGARGSRNDDAAATFVVLLGAASIIHLIGAPEVEGVMFGTAASNQFWKPVLGFFAILGAGVIAFTTLTGKARQVRPFFVATVIPAAVLLPSAAFFTFVTDDPATAWLQRAMQAGITMAMLSLVWYVFGPGRRTVSGSAGSPSQAEPESSALASSVRLEPTAETVTDGC